MKFSDETESLMLTRCGQWLTAGNVARRVDTLPGRAVEAIADRDKDALLGALELDGDVAVTWDGPELPEPGVDMVRYVNTGFYLVGDGRPDYIAFQAPNVYAFFSRFYTEGLPELYGPPEGAGVFRDADQTLWIVPVHCFCLPETSFRRNLWG